MDEDSIKELLLRVQDGNLNISEAVNALRNLPYENMIYAKVDHHRFLRHGFPEVVYCKGKTTEQIIGITKSLLKNKGTPILATRISKESATVLLEVDSRFVYNETAGLVFLLAEGFEQKEKQGNIVILSAGTSDLAVVEEAYLTAFVLGNNVSKVIDVGVAGIHRLFAHKDIIDCARVIIVVAGMDGALASVVGGLVNKPVIAVPTSIGYGANFGGLSALLSMLNSCSPNVLTVNIDNGFGAAYSASLINKL